MHLKKIVLSSFILIGAVVLMQGQACQQSGFQLPSSVLRNVATDTGDLSKAPVVKIVSSLEGVANVASASFAFTATSSNSTAVKSIECQMLVIARPFGQPPPAGEAAPEFTACSSPFVYNFASGGVYKFSIRAADERGNVSVPISSQFTVDLLKPVLSLSSSPSKFSGTTSANFVWTAVDDLSGVSLLECALDQAVFAACVSPVNLTSLAIGNHLFKIRARDAAGNLSEVLSFDWNIDTSLPFVQLAQTPQPLTNAASIVFAFTGMSGNAALTSFQCQMDAGVFATCTSPLTYTNLPEGAHTFAVKGINAQGIQSSPISFAFNLDRTAPVLQLTKKPEAVIKLNNVSFEFVASDQNSMVSGFECKLDAAAFSACTSPQALNTLGEGAHSFSVRAKDNAGNLSTVNTTNFSVDTIAPVINLTGMPPTSSTESNATFVFNATDAGGIKNFECNLDNMASTVCASPKAYLGLSNGAHSFKLRAVDLAGNVSAEKTYAWTVSGGLPPDGAALYATNCASCHQALASSTKIGRTAAQITASIADVTSMNSLATVLNAAQIQAIANALQPVDAPPIAQILTSPNTLVNVQSHVFTFSATSMSSTIAGFECQLYLTSQTPPAFSACTSPMNYNLANDGLYQFSLRAKDAKNKYSNVVSKQFTVDTSKPIVNVSSAPPSTTALSTASFVFNASDNLSGVAKFECALDTAAFTVCTSPQNLNNLAVGTHTFKIRALDLAGNISLESLHNWTISAGVPSVMLVKTPTALNNLSTASFEFSGSAPQGQSIVGYQCSLDSSAFTACTSPVNYTNLSEGNRSFAVRSLSSAGVTSTAVSYSWKIDRTLPTVTLSQTPNALANITTASFSFTGIDSGMVINNFECQMDTGVFATCASPKGYTGLMAGAHVFKVRSKDLAGNVSGEASFNFSIDTTLPVLTILTKPPTTTADSNANFTFSASDANGVKGYECSLDGQAFAACASPKAYTSLASGVHNFKARATDNAGNLSQEVSHAWTITGQQMLDGAGLYMTYCRGCHGLLATSTMINRTAAQIAAAINNVGRMNSLKGLTTAEVQAIADALATKKTNFYLGTNGKMHGFQLDQNLKTFTYKGNTIFNGDNASWLAYDETSKKVFVADGGSKTVLQIFQPVLATGVLNLQTTLNSFMNRVVHLTVLPKANGFDFFAASYSDALMGYYQANAQLSQLSKIQTVTYSEMAKTHSSSYDPVRKLLYVANLGLNKINVYRLEQTGLVALTEIAVPYPRTVKYDSVFDKVYVVTESPVGVASYIRAYSIVANGTSFNYVDSGSQAMPATGGDLQINHTYRYAMGTAREAGKESVWAMPLTATGVQDTSRPAFSIPVPLGLPRVLLLSADEKYMVVGASSLAKQDNVSVYLLNFDNQLTYTSSQKIYGTKLENATYSGGVAVPAQ